MSCAWTYFCNDCQKEADFSWNHGDLRLKEILARRKDILEFMGMFDRVNDLVEVELNIIGPDDSSRSLFTFIVEHDKHRIRLKNEYGHFADECSKRLDVGEGQRTCIAPVGHEGECVPGVRTWSDECSVKRGE